MPSHEVPNVPRVNVIIPARNAAETLSETLASLAAQTFVDWEVILVDDGSADETAAIGRAFHGPLRLLANESSKGPSASRNMAAEFAGGELLAMLDADDLWKPDYLRRLVAQFDAARESGRRVGIVAANAEILGPDGLLPETFHDRVGFEAPVTMRRLLYNNVLLPMALCPRDVFLEVGGYNASVRYGEDYDLWLRIVERGYDVIVDESVLATYRVRHDAASTSTAELARGTARVYELALQRRLLSSSERRLARRQRRLQLAVAARASIATAGREGERTLERRLRALPLTALAALEHPERWIGWVRSRPRDAQGLSRHEWRERGRLRRRRAHG